MEEGFQKTYGSLKRTATGVYTLTKTPDEGLISGVNIQSNVKGVWLTDDFSNVSIAAPNATVKINSLEANADKYLVTIYSGTNAGVMGLSGIAEVSLSSGSLRADENIDVIVAGGRYIKAGEDSVITLVGASKNATIGGLDIDESFSIDENSYTLSAIGLTNDKSQLLEDFTVSSGEVFMKESSE